jgi:hypothetical protein
MYVAKIENCTDFKYTVALTDLLIGEVYRTELLFIFIRYMEPKSFLSDPCTRSGVIQMALPITWRLTWSRNEGYVDLSVAG